MTNRRKFLLGMGSLAAGGAAAMGTGAFSSQARRSMDIDVVGDAYGYLGIDANTSSEYVEESSPMSIDLASASGVSGGDSSTGTGLPEMADTAIVPAFHLTNQSQETLYVEIDNPLANNDITTAGSGDAPAGVDVQFLSAESLPLADYNDNKNISLIGRDTGPNTNPLGAEFDELGSNGYWFHSLEGEGTNRSDRTTLQESRSGTEHGALEIDSGESYPVVFRVVLREPDAAIPASSFRIEAYDDEDNLDYSTVSWST